MRHRTHTFPDKGDKNNDTILGSLVELRVAGIGISIGTWYLTWPSRELLDQYTTILVLDENDELIVSTVFKPAV
jgi:hypothetical protein